MHSIIFHLLAAILIALSFVFPGAAGELYLWEDNKGMAHITDYPPPADTGRIISQDQYVNLSPGEIRQQQSREQMENLREKRQTETNDNLRHYDNAYTRLLEERRREMHAFKVEQAKAALERAERLRDEYADQRRNARSQWGSDFYTERFNKQDRIAKEKWRELMELERQ